MPGPLFVQGTSHSNGAGGGAGTTDTLVFTGPNTAGNLSIVTATVSGSLGINSVTGSVNGAYTLAGNTGTWMGVGNFWCAIYYAWNIGAGTDSVTINYQYWGNSDVTLQEYSGVVNTGNPLDPSAFSVATATSTSLDSGAITTSASGDLLFGFAANQTTSTFTPGSGFTVRESPEPSLNQSLDMVVGAAGAYHVLGTISSSITWGCMGAAFKAASGGPNFTILPTDVCFMGIT